MKFFVFLALCCSARFSVQSFFLTKNKQPSLTTVNAKTNLTTKDSKSNKYINKKWEFGRFLKTAFYYDAFRPNFKLFQKALPVSVVTKGFVFWSPNVQNVVKWGPLDDVIMGGISKSDLEPGSAFNGTWTGYVTTEGGGGFAGIRTKLFKPAFNASLCEGFELKVRGDGQRYKFIARDDDDFNGVAWSTSFDTSQGKSVKVKVPFAKLKPTKFARTVPNSAKFDSSRLTGLQISLSKFEYDGGVNPSFRDGLFKLVIEEIKTF